MPTTPFPTLTESPNSDAVLPRYELTEWREHFGLVAGVTGAAPGADLAIRTSEPATRMLERWRAFRSRLGAEFPGVVLGTQCHGTTLAVHAPSTGMRLVDDTDGHLTTSPGVLLSVTVADCVPVYLAHPESGAVALLHAGWRGIAAGIVEAGIERLCRLADSDPASVTIHCGVSICGECYEVGPEVKEVLLGVSGPRGPVDLRAAIAARAANAAVERITISPWCTAHDAPRFFSHRASGGAPQRMLAYLGRPDS